MASWIDLADRVEACGGLLVYEPEPSGWLRSCVDDAATQVVILCLPDAEPVAMLPLAALELMWDTVQLTFPDDAGDEDELEVEG